ncbi:MAG: hypothetical protein ABI467_29340 [Kofleriaceae bacterium]
MRVESWLVIAAVLGFGSCTGGNMMPREQIEQPVPTASGPPPPLYDDPKTQVDTLQADLVARRAALSLPTPPALPEVCEPVCAIEDPPDKPSRTAGCAPGAGSACATACVQADAACDDAAQICTIARGLPTDALVAGRCRDARITCADAHAPCCACTSR